MTHSITPFSTVSPLGHFPHPPPTTVSTSFSLPSPFWAQNPAADENWGLTARGRGCPCPIPAAGRGAPTWRPFPPPRGAEGRPGWGRRRRGEGGGPRGCTCRRARPSPVIAAAAFYFFNFLDPWVSFSFAIPAADRVCPSLARRTAGGSGEPVGRRGGGELRPSSLPISPPLPSSPSLNRVSGARVASPGFASPCVPPKGRGVAMGVGRTVCDHDREGLSPPGWPHEKRIIGY